MNRINGIKPLSVLLSALVYNLYYLLQSLLPRMCVEKVMGKKFCDSVDRMFLTLYCDQFSLISAIGFDYLCVSYSGKIIHYRTS